jgi:co-chaperonin GroES (HSP10)
MSKQTIKNFKPTRDWVVVEDPREEETEGGIILPDNVKAKLQSNISKIISVGPDCKQAKTGDLAMINPTTTGNIIEIENRSYIMIPEHFCMGIFEQNA